MQLAITSVVEFRLVAGAIAITVTEIKFCELSSSPIAFRYAAHAAAKSILDIRCD